MGSQPKPANGMTFDLQILDSNITTEISRDASIVFAHWPTSNTVDKSILGPSQRITKWRPTHNVALISDTKDLSSLARRMPNEFVKNLKIDCFHVIFQYENILRLEAK